MRPSPAPTAGSCFASPIRIAFPPACSTRSRIGASTRVSAIPASSTTSTHRSGSSLHSRSRWSVIAEMPVSSRSCSAAIPDGAAPSTRVPAARYAEATACTAVVLPAPATPTTHTTRSGLETASRAIAVCSGDRLRPTIASPGRVGRFSPRPRSTSARALRSTPISSVVVNQAGRPGCASVPTFSSSGARAKRRASSRTRSASAPLVCVSAQAITSWGSEKRGPLRRQSLGPDQHVSNPL